MGGGQLWNTPPFSQIWKTSSPSFLTFSIWNIYGNVGNSEAYFSPRRILVQLEKNQEGKWCRPTWSTCWAYLILDDCVINLVKSIFCSSAIILLEPQSRWAYHRHMRMRLPLFLFLRVFFSSSTSSSRSYSSSHCRCSCHGLHPARASVCTQLCSHPSCISPHCSCVCAEIQIFLRVSLATQGTWGRP